MKPTPIRRKPKPARPPTRPRLLVEELEPRILYSADAAALLGLGGLPAPALVRELEPAPVLGAAAAAPQADTTTPAQAADAREIVFIDSRVPDAMTLADALMQQRGGERQFDIVVLDANEDGIAQINRILAQEQGLAAIHIISHGSDGAIEIGSTPLDAARLTIDADAVARWGQALGADGDLLLYGCDVAKDAAGQAFIQNLARLTGADVAASSDLTGKSTLGGNWTLEFATGDIQATLVVDTAAQRAWTGTLAISEGSTSSAVTSSSGANTLTWSHTIGAGADGVLIVEVSSYATGGPTVTSLTYGGTALTLIGTATNSASVELWYLKAPTAGTANISVTLSGTATIAAGATTYFGVDQTTPFGAFQSATGASTTPTLNVTSTAGALVVDAVASRAVSTSSTGAGQTQSWTQKSGSAGGDVWGASSTEAGAASVTMSWSKSGSGAGAWAIGAVSLNPTTSTAPTIANLSGDTLAYSVGSAATLIEQGGNAAVTDIDSPNFDTGALTVSFAAGGVSAQDVLAIRNQGTGAGQIGVAGANVSYAGTTIGTWAGGTGGANLVVTLNANANATSTAALIRNITYQNTETTVPTMSARTLRFVLSDGDGGISANVDTTVNVTSSTLVVVTSNLDTAAATDGDTSSIAALNASKGTDGLISLREAITAANNTAGADTIRFNIAGTGVHTIAPTAALPQITGQVTIDATTDDSFAANGNRPAIIVAGTNAGFGADGLVLTSTADGSTIRGLVVRDWDADGISIRAGSDNNLIVGNYIGRINADGTAAAAGTQNNGDGVYVLGSNNTIGGTTAADRNVISGNDDGVTLDTGATGNIIIGNYIGTDATGAVVVGNTVNAGVWVKAGNNNRIGGTGSGEGNLIANNTGDGIQLQTGAGSGNSILGNTSYSNSGQGIDLGTSGITANDAGDADTGANNLQNFPVLTSAISNATGTTIVGTINSNANTTLRIEFFGNRPTVADTPNGEGERFLGFTTVTTDGSGNASVNTTLANVWVNSGDRITATATVDLGGGNYGSTSEFAANVAASSTGIVVVDTTSDTVDGTTTSIINLGNNRGADGRISLREAIAAANATPNGGSADKIVFAIPVTDANHLYYRNNGVGGTFASPVTTTLVDAAIADFDADYAAGTARSWYRITLGTTNLDVTQAVIIDGSTQAGYDVAKGPIIEINAAAVAGGDANAIALTTGGSTIRGLVINRAGDNAIEIDVGATSSVIVGNFIGTDVSGTQALGNSTVGSWGAIGIKANNVVVGGTTAADRNLISGNLGSGIELYNAATGALIRGNYIGTTVTGISALGNATAGVDIRNNSANNTVGGVAAGQGNTIAFNGGDGVSIVTAISGNVVRGNSIHSNTGLAIDLNNDGVTPNDTGDGDAGPNALKNFPVVTLVTTSGSAVTVSGTLNTVPSVTQTIDFYSSPAADGTGFGEGTTYIGSTVVTTDGSGNASFSNISLAHALPVGHVVTAVTVDLASGNTSEFSRNAVAISSVQATITVDTTADTNDGNTTSLSTLLANKGADGFISLREAIIATNNTANGSSADKIVFAIAGAGVHTITIGATALPTITQAVNIDGWSEPDYSGTPVIELNGNNAGSLVKGLTLGAGSDGSTIRGLIINRFTGTGIEISGSNNHTIQGNWIGLNATGTAAAANGVKGIYATNSIGLLIGGTTAATRNVVSGNAEQGIYFNNVDNSTISGNYVGTTANGTGDVNGTVGNSLQSGVFLTNGSSGNTVGGTTAGARNVLSGNNHFGFEVLFGSQNNLLQGNYIGTDATGMVALGNINGGAVFWNAGTGNVFGGSAAGARNVIAGNTFNGVLVGNASTGATIQGNYIGVGADGITQLGNGANGIIVEGASTNTLIGTDANGTNDANERNVISGNAGEGIQIRDAGTTGAVVRGNYIGTNAAGTVALGNAANGIAIYAGASGNTIGGTAAGAGNVLSGNGENGIAIANSGTAGNLVLGNTIGLNATQTAVIGNTNQGIWIGSGASGNTVGGTAAGSANIIGGNTYAGVELHGAGTSNNTVAGNIIGSDATGTANFGNGEGVAVALGAANNLIGGTAALAGNLIVNSGGSGVVVDAASLGNAVLGNSIRGNAGLGIDLGNNGVSANDVGDADTGANNLQNFPVLATARTNASNQLILTGTLNSTTNSYLRIEFFANTSQDGTGHGEGQTYLGFANVAADGSGNATISTTLTANVAVGSFISATATRSNITYTTFTDTSEFARSIAAVSSTQAVATVDTTADTSDGDTTSLSALLANKGADGFISLREAIVAANNTANGTSADRIVFNIAGSGPHTINVSAAGLAQIADTVIIDGTSEPDFAGTPIIELNGTGTGATVDGLFLAAGSDGSTIRGLVINRFGRDGISGIANNVVIAGNYVGTDTTGAVDLGNGQDGIQAGDLSLGGGNNWTIGGATAADRNIVSGNADDGVQLFGTGNTVLGNYIGTNASGSAAVGNTDEGVEIASTSSGNTIGGTAAGARNVISGNSGEGILINITTGNLVLGNYIGVDATGTVDLGNAASGVNIKGGTSGNTIGGAAAGAVNVISGNNTFGIWLDNGDSNTIQGNRIGTNAAGTAGIANSSQGIMIVNGSDGNLIGGTAAGQGNLVAHNTYDGVAVTGGTTNAILGNSFDSNGGRAIDLNDDGSTLNDIPGNMDSDLGPNNLQNFPVLTSATTTGAQVTFTGTLNSTANTQFRIEFFASTTQDGSGYGEGQRYLGFANVTTDGSGNATISATLTAAVASGEFISATATQSNAGFTVFTDTSEFAQNVMATVAPVITATGSTLAYTENAAAAPVDSGLTVSDADSTNLTGATVTISVNYANGQDVLAFTNQLGITGSWSAATGVMTLTGITTVANYQTALRAVTYVNTSDAPSTATRTASFTVDDGNTASAAATRNISVAALNDAPTLGNGTLAAVNEDTANPAGQSVSTSFSGQFADADSGASFAGIAVVGNTANAGTQGVWQYSSNGGSNWFAIGTVADGTTALAISTSTLVRFVPVADYNGTPPALTVRGLDNTYPGLFSTTAGSESRSTVNTTVNGATTFIAAATASLSTLITAVNDAPVAVADTATAVEAGGTANGTAGTNPTGNVLSNDSDADAADTQTVTGVAAGTVGSAGGNVASSVVGAFGSITIAANGAYTYVVDNSNPTVQALRQSGGTLGEVFTYTMRDTAGLTSSTQITVTIQGANDAPSGIALVAPTPTNLIVNGSFETNNGLANNSSSGIAVTVAGWTAVGGEGLEVWNNFNSGGPTTPSDGISILELDVTGAAVNGIAQNVSTVLGQNYVLSFDFSGRLGNTDIVDVFWRNTLIGTVTQTSVGWQTQTFIVTGSGGSDELRLMESAAQNDGVGALLDNVSLFADISSAVTVPENSANGTAVATAAAFDADRASGDTLTYSLTDTAAGRFAINGTNGQITVANGSLLNFEGATSHAITIRATDLAGLAFDRNITIGVSNLNETPALSNLNGTPTYIENGSPVFLDADVQIADPELSASNDFSGATLTLVRNGGASAQDVFSFDGTNVTTSGANVSVGGVQVGTFTHAGGQLVVTFGANATQARVNTLMQNTLYANSSDAPPASVQVNWTFNDANSGAQGAGGALSATGNVMVTITALNDAPTLGDGALAAVNEDTASPGGQAVSTIFTGQFADADSGASFAGIAVVGNTANAGTQGIWQYSSNGGSNWFAIGTVSDGTTALAISTSTLIRFVPVADYNGAAPALTVRGLDNTFAGSFSTTAGSESRATVNTATHGGTTAIAAATAALSTAITAVNDAPVITTTGTELAYTENAAASAIDPALTISDVDSSNLTGATVTLSANYVNGQDLLAFTNQLGITGSWNAGTGILTLSGTTTVANYQTALRAVTYVNISENPSVLTRTASLVVSDGTNSSNTGLCNISVAAANDAPTATNLNAAQTYTEDTPLGLTGIVISDVDSASVTATLSLSNIAAGSLNTGTSGAVTSTFVGGVWTASGALADVNALLAALSFTPTLNFNSSFNITTSVSDGVAAPISGSKTLTGTAVNDAPVLASIGNQTINEGGTLTFTASSTDADLPAQSLTYSVDAASLALGMTINSSTGVFGWAPTEAQGGLTPSVTITVTDNGTGNLTDSATFTITVADLNSAPVLDAIGNQSVNEGVTLTFTASAADSDLPAQSLSYSLDAASLALGMSINSSTGVFSWTPSEAQGGLSPSVTITVTDNGTGTLTDSETFTITVAELNSAPVLASIGNRSVNEGSTLTFTASATDADLPTQSLSYSLDAASLALGMKINASTGAFSWTPSEAQGGLTPSVTVTVTDNGTGTLTDSETFTITVADLNSAPVLASIGNRSVNEGSTLTFTASAADPDLPSQSLSYSLDAASLALGMTINASTGAFSWTPSEAQGGLTLSVTVTVTDNGTGTLTDSETFTITVAELNSAPVLASIGNRSVNEGATLTFTASAADSDLPTQSLSYSLDAASLALGMSINTSTGAFSWTPTESQGGLTPSVTITVTDNGTGNLTDSETFTISVADLNSAPVLDAIGAQSVNEGATLTFTASATDADLPSQSLTYSLDAASLALGMTINASTGVFSWTPSEAQGGLSPSVTVTVNDNGTGTLSDSESFTITVTELNSAPVLAAIGNRLVNEGATLTFTASATDADLPTQSLSYSLDAASLALGMSINTSTGAFSWTPTESQGGLTPSVTITVTDNGTGTLTDSETFTITVADLNSAPVLASIGAQSVNEGATLTFTASATDADLPTQSLSYSLDAASLALGMSINTSTGAFSWTPTESQGGLTPSVTITVTDNGTGTLTDSETFTISVADLNSAPVLSAIGAQSVNEGATLTFTASAADPDLPSQSLTYSLDAASLALGMTINASTGAFSWTPTEAQGGMSPLVTVTVTDNGTGNLTDSETFSISVADLNSAPVLASIGNRSVNEGATLTFTASAADSDLPTQSLSYSLDAASLALGMSINSSTGVFSWTPSEAQGGLSSSVTITVTDNGTGNLSDSESFTITVTDLNSAPVLATIGAQPVNESATLTFTASATDADLPTQSLSYSLDAASLALGMSINASSGAFSWTPSEAQGGLTPSVTVTVTDNGTGNQTDSETFTITVTDLNSAPVLATIGAQSVNEGATLTFTASAADSDSPTQSLSYGLDAASLALGMTINASTGVFSWTPSEAQGGLAPSVTVTVTDNGTGTLTDSETFTITVADLNSAPVLASIGNRSVNEGSTLTFTASATDADLPTQSLSYSLDAASLALGMTINASTGAFSWTPSEAQGGLSPSVTITVTDNGTGNLNDSETFTISVAELNSAPVLDAIGAQSVNEGATLTFTASAADSDLPTQSLSYGLDAASLALGMSINSSTGVFSWTPSETQGGLTPSVTVTVTDNGTGNLNDSETFTISVADLNSAPVLSAIGAQSVNESATLTFTASATDADLPAQSLSYSLDAASLALGMTINASTGAFSWTPSEAQGGLTPSVTVTVTDNGTGTLTDSETFTISVAELNSAPVLASIGNRSVNEGATLTFTASAADSDLPSQSLTYSLDAASLALGMTINASTGAFSWTPSEAQGGLTPSVTVTVTDTGTGNLTDSETFSISVADLNSAPVLDAIGAQSVNEGATLTFTASAADPDLPSQSLTYSLDAASLALGTTINASTGVFSWTPSEAQGGLTPSVTITVTDNGTGNLTDSETFTISVADLNSAPVLDAIGAQSVNEGATLTFTASATDADLPTQSLSYSLDAASLALGMTINASTGAFAWTPTESQGGLTPSVTITVTDNGTGNLTDSETFTISVADLNSAPVLDAIGNQSVNESATLTFTASATDADLPAQSLSYSLDAASLALGMSINTSTGAFSWTPTESQGGLTPSVTVTVTDNGTGNLTDSETFTITVTDLNSAPVLATIGAQSVNEGATLTFTASAADSDSPTQSLSYGLDAASLALGMTINASTGAFSWTPTEAQGGLTPSVTITATDNGTGNLTDSEALTITVVEVNDAPAATPVTLAAIAEDSGAHLITQAALLATATDVDGQALTATGLTIRSGNGSLVDNGNGSWTYTPPLNDDGAVSFSYVVTDGSLLVAASATLDITAVNDAPAITSGGGGSNAALFVAETTTALTTTITTVIATDADLPAQTLTYSIVGGADAARFTIDGASGALSFVAAPDFEAPGDAGADNVYDVIVRAFDGSSGSTQAIAVALRDVNEAPLVADSGPNVAEGMVDSIDLAAAASDVDAGANGIIDRTSVVVVTGPAHGSLVVRNDGTATYAHDGSETTSDSFSYTLRDAAGVESNVATVRFTVTLVNDAPTLGAAALALNGSQAVLLDSSQMFASDTDDATTSLWFVVSEVRNGRFEWVAAPGTAIDQFAQTDVDAGRVRFVSTSSTDAPSFRVAAFDGRAYSAAVSATVRFAAGAALQAEDPAAGEPVAVLVTVAPDSTAAVPRPAAAATPTLTASASTDEPAQELAAPGSGAESSDVVVGRSELDAARSGSAAPAPEPVRSRAGQDEPDSKTPSPLVDYLLGTLEIREPELAQPAQARLDAALSSDGSVAAPPGDEEGAAGLSLAEAAQAGGLALTAGTVWWALRAGGLLSGLLMALPAWRHADLLAVLPDDEDEDAWDQAEDAEAARDENAAGQLFDPAFEGDLR